MPPEPPRLIDAGTDDEPVEPRVEAVRVPERGQITPGADECVLHGVLACSGFRRMSQAAESSREIAAPASVAKAS
jgi:hypothetical protein